MGIRTLDPKYQNTIGQRGGFSKVDVQQIKLMYTKLPKTCNRCICNGQPGSGLQGIYCSEWGAQAKWCYVDKDSGCPDIKQSTDKNLFYSYKVCGGDAPKPNTPEPSPKPDPSCKDVVTQCKSYGAARCKSPANWAAWMAKYCKSFCGLCGAPKPTAPPKPTTPPKPKPTTACKDVSSRCSVYGKTKCSTPANWATWMKKYCKSFCGVC